MEQLEQRAGLIRDVRMTPLSMPLRQPFVWAQGEATGLEICIHGSFTTGITTCAEHQIARLLPNLARGNQIMSQLLRDRIVARTSLTRERGQIVLAASSGLGFEPARAAVGSAAERFSLEAD